MTDAGLTRLGRFAMRCRFEVAVCGEGYRARAAGEAALREIERLEPMLSPFDPGSEIAAVNAAAGGNSVRVSGEVFALLTRCRDLWEQTAGAFDPTVGPLMQLYGFRGNDAVPDDEALSDAMSRVGMDKVTLDRSAREVRLTVAGMQLDLGAVGKGYAIDAAAEALAETGFHGLLHAGTSTIRATGPMPDGTPWPIAIRDPLDADAVAEVVRLRAASLSVSGRRGRVNQVGEVEFSHIVDPRTGRTAEGLLLAVLVTAEATDGDALSTALLLDGEHVLPRLRAGWSTVRESAVYAALVPLGEDGAATVG